MVHYRIKDFQLRKCPEAQKGRRLLKKADENKEITKVRLVKQSALKMCQNGHK